MQRCSTCNGTKESSQFMSERTGEVLKTCQKCRQKKSSATKSGAQTELDVVQQTVEDHELRISKLEGESLMLSACAEGIMCQLVQALSGVPFGPSEQGACASGCARRAFAGAPHRHESEATGAAKVLRALYYK